LVLNEELAMELGADADALRTPDGVAVLVGNATSHGASPVALDRIRDVLSSGGRTLAQGSLSWLLARSEAFVPIPGTRTVAQAKENAGAIAHGPLSPAEMGAIETSLGELGLR
jgi:aryl-alcohol dehydrogenase-like predicted oxidoreductase